MVWFSLVWFKKKVGFDGSSDNLKGLYISGIHDNVDEDSGGTFSW